MDKQFASLASQLAVSLIWDLGLQMPPPEIAPQFPYYSTTTSVPQQSFRKERTIEEKRVVLGAFVITSMCVLHFYEISPAAVISQIQV